MKEFAAMKLLNPFRSLFAARQTAPAHKDDDLPHVYDWTMRSESDIYITEENAASIATVWACVTLISKSIAMLPAHVFVPRGDSDQDGADRMPNHSIARLLHIEPNPQMSAMTFRERIMTSALLWGNGWAEIQRDAIGRPVALWPIHPERVTSYHTAGGDDLYFEVSTGNGNKVSIAASDMFHVAGPATNADSPLGDSIISHARNSLGLALSQEREAGALARNGAKPSGILGINGAATDTGRARLKADVDKFLRGTRNHGRILVSYNGDKTWTQVGLTAHDAQFMEQRQFTIYEICRWFGCPPQKIADMTRATYSNFEEANRAFLVDGLMPWICRFEMEANRKLIGIGNGRGRQPYIKLNFNAIIRPDQKKRYEIYALGRAWGILSANDCRRYEDLAPIEGGDEFLIPTAYLPPTQSNSDNEVREALAALAQITRER